MIVHVWVTRALCGCCYLWTTPGAASVVCACGSASIVDDVIVAGNAVTDEAAFTAAVAADFGVTVDELVLVKA